MPARIDVLASLKADVIALQESSAPAPAATDMPRKSARPSGLGWVMAPARHLRGHLFGNVVLSHFSIRQHVQYDLSWKTCEPRCCQRVDLAVDDRTLHLFNVHLGTAFRERRAQAERLASIVHDRRVPEPKVLLGDFNEWSRGRAMATLTERLKNIDLRIHLRSRRTYPGIFPLLHLDHIYYQGHVDIVGSSCRADAALADGIGSPAVDCRAARRLRIDARPVSAMRGHDRTRRFFEFLFAGGTDTGGRPERFAVVEDRKVADVQVIWQPGAFSSTTTVTGLPSTPWRNPTRHPQARRACVRPFMTRGCSTSRSYYSRAVYSRAVISRSNCSFFESPMCFLQILPSRVITNVMGKPHIGPNAFSLTSSRPSPTRSG